ncbi:hypothetical protein [Roseomonas genomospecies 6]|uniref:Uncharacterized protein n=1 Tax=Roseomonas genomospecies 6 TaxID=214106 RepID=A0A9W7NGH1_9PROT|nr:hypothetical protein [Roseomonas genomospecies 6]KAA0677600.1 hypothetical protein DS843_22435 [Roseomonas genomospecies 6]
MSTTAPSWSVRQLAGQAYGCTLSVTYRGPDQWLWYVMVVDHRIGDGVARTMKAAQDAAVAAAKRHADQGGTVQLGLF